MRDSDLEWGQLPGDAGQIIDVRYAVDWEGEWLYRRSYDQSDRSLIIERVALDEPDRPENDVFEPWNGILPPHDANDFEAVEVTR